MGSPRLSRLGQEYSALPIFQSTKIRRCLARSTRDSRRKIEAGTTLKDVPEPETKLNSHDVTLFAVENFKKENLKEVKTEEKTVLPTAEDIAAEKAEAS